MDSSARYTMKALKTPKKTNTTKISLGRVLPRLDSTSDAPVKLIFLVLYILGAILIWHTQADIAASTEKIEYISPIAEFAARNIFDTYRKEICPGSAEEHRPC